MVAKTLIVNKIFSKYFYFNICTFYRTLTYYCLMKYYPVGEYFVSEWGSNPISPLALVEN